MSKIKVRFLGTNGWYDTKIGNTICILIETANEYVVLDAGNGLYKLDKYIKDTRKPIYLFLSHFHLDHIIGLHVLAKFDFKQGINLYVRKGGRKAVNTFVSKPFTVPFKELRTRFKIIEIGPRSKIASFVDKVLPLKHSDICFGFRFKFGNRIISYVPDTGLCENADILAQDCDLLITECAYKMGQDCSGWPHLTPETAAAIAKKASAKKLALVHFDAAVYQSLKERKGAEKKAKKLFKNTIAARDGQEIYV